MAGILGQDGAYLAELLLNKGYEVFDGFRRSSSLNTWRLKALGVDRELRLIPLDLLEFTDILRVIKKIWPDEFYDSRGTAEQHIKEGKNAINWTRQSCHSFRNNEARLQLHALAYNFGNFLCALVV